MSDTMQKLRDRALLIENEINNALGRIDHNDCPDPVNWGDVGCIEVSLVLSGTTPEWRAIVSEAAPDCPNLTTYLHGELAKLGQDVFITTEW